MRRLQAPAGAVYELIDQRNIRSKVWSMGGRRRALAVGMSVQHVPNDVQSWAKGEAVQWDEVDPQPVFVDGKFRVGRAWYEIELDPQSFQFSYVSKVDGHRLSVALSRLGGALIGQIDTRYAPEIRGDSVVFVGIRPELDLELEFRPHGVEIWKHLNGARAPREFEWEVLEDESPESRVTFETLGYDNQSNLPRDGRKRRSMHIETALGVVNREGRVLRRYSERWTGKTLRRDAVTRVIGLADDVLYPAAIDLTINEAITASGDDGTEDVSDGTWADLYHAYYGSRNYYLGTIDREQAGWRFQAVTGIASGDTVNSATLTLNVNTVQAGGVTATIYGYDTDDAAAWVNTTVLPSVVAKTTASVSQAMTTTGSKPVDVTTIVAEIIARAGWASGNDMSLFVEGGSGTGAAFVDEIDATNNVEATLVIDYTAAGPDDETASADGVSASATAGTVSAFATPPPPFTLTTVTG